VAVLVRWRGPALRVVKRRLVLGQRAEPRVRVEARVRVEPRARVEPRVMVPVRPVARVAQVQLHPPPGRRHQLQVPERASATKTERCAAIAA